MEEVFRCFTYKSNVKLFTAAQWSHSRLGSGRCEWTKSPSCRRTHRDLVSLDSASHQRAAVLQVSDQDGDDKVEQADTDTPPPRYTTCRHRWKDRRWRSRENKWSGLFELLTGSISCCCFLTCLCSFLLTAAGESLYICTVIALTVEKWIPS